MSLRRLLFLLPLALPLVGCPSGTSDDDDTPLLGDDDDAAPDPCLDVEDITAQVESGDSVSGGTNNENDDFTGSCDETAAGSADALFVFTPSQTGAYLLSTEDPSTDFDTILFAFLDCDDPVGTELGCNDDVDTQAQIYTSELVIQAEAGVPVYVAIDGYEAVGHYEMTVEPLVCGDGVVAGNEMCDDGNEVPGDGCDEQCVWECVDDDREDDDTIETATAATEFPATIEGTLCPTDSTEEYGVFADWWSLDLTVGEYVSVTATPTGGGDCSELVLTLGVFDEEIAALATVTSEEGECPSIAMEANLTDRYYLAVFGDDVTVPPQDYALEVTVGVAECGNGAVEGLEECDDGNVDPSDTCSDTCTENDAECTVVDTVTTAASVTGDATDAGDAHQPSCGPPGGEDVVYQYDAVEDQIVIVTTDLPATGDATDTILHVRGQCTNTASELACNDDIAQGNLRSQVGFRAEAGQSYFIVVDTYQADSGPFELGVSLATCGDGTLEPGEDCDDGNVVPGDGCEADCTTTPVCTYTADHDLGLLSAGDTNLSVDLTAAADTLPDLPCSAPGGADSLIKVEVGAVGTLAVAVDHEGGDVQYALFADDGSCSAKGACVDLGEGTTAGTVAVAVEPGAYYLVLDSWGADEIPKTTVDLVFSAP